MCTETGRMLTGFLRCIAVKIALVSLTQSCFFSSTSILNVDLKRSQHCSGKLVILLISHILLHLQTQSFLPDVLQGLPLTQPALPGPCKLFQFSQETSQVNVNLAILCSQEQLA